MRLGVNVSAPLMYGLSWILLGIAVLMVVLAIATALGVEWLPTTAVTDVIAAAICSLLALVCRSLGRRFERPI
jgi:4-amino-4-deoxy-L-arabinose transferase-like glycosyltransferase